MVINDDNVVIYGDLMIYPLVIKHGLLEDTYHLIYSDVPIESPI